MCSSDLAVRRVGDTLGRTRTCILSVRDRALVLRATRVGVEEAAVLSEPVPEEISDRDADGALPERSRWTDRARTGFLPGHVRASRLLRLRSTRTRRVTAWGSFDGMKKAACDAQTAPRSHV